jgi:hypothetical protein
MALETRLKTHGPVDNVLPAIQQRADVPLAKKTRQLRTRLDAAAFDEPFRGTGLTCGQVIRQYFHTDIQLGCNDTQSWLVSMDGQRFSTRC